MTSLLKWSSAYGTLLLAFQSSDLNSVTDTTYKFGTDTNAVIDNTSGLQLFTDAVVNLGSFTPGTGGFFNLWVITSIDGTNFADPQSAAEPPAGTPVYSQGLVSGASAKVNIVRGILLPPGKSKLLFQSRAGATLASSSNSIKYCPAYGYNLNG